MRVLVAGGDGFCGWSTVLYRKVQGHRIFMADNLGRRRWDEGLVAELLTWLSDLETRVVRWKEPSGREVGICRRPYRRGAGELAPTPL